MKKEFELISMIDFISQYVQTGSAEEQLSKIKKYFDFLTQPLHLGMFIPCDSNGNVLEEPIYTTDHSDDCYCPKCENETRRCSDLQQKRRQAKEQILFNGCFGLSCDGIDLRLHSIGGSLNVARLGNYKILTLVGFDITLTEYGFKNIEL